MFKNLVLRSFAGPAPLAVLSLLVAMSLNASGQTMSYDEIRGILDANPPATGDLALREEAILQLDAYLKRPTAPFDPDYFEFYTDMMANLTEEVALPVPSGARIWQMYNHGYIVKTPSSTFAFDLINFRAHVLPTSLLEQIDVAFISHVHNDHSGAPSATIVSLGGGVVAWYNLPAGSQTTIAGLDVAAYCGQHGSTTNNIYRVTTPEGLTIMHTGDTQRSIDLPNTVPTDILLINAWMNESGSQPATVGMRNGINRVGPDLTIPGHIQELGHAYNPASPITRVPYEWALAVDDVPVAGAVSVMAPGEHYDYNVVPEPSALALLGMGAVAVLAHVGRRRVKARPWS